MPELAHVYQRSLGGPSLRGRAHTVARRGLLPQTALVRLYVRRSSCAFSAKLNDHLSMRRITQPHRCNIGRCVTRGVVPTAFSCQRFELCRAIRLPSRWWQSPVAPGCANPANTLFTSVCT